MITATASTPDFAVKVRSETQNDRFLGDTVKRLLDTSVFITAKNSYYAFDVVPAFWKWLETEAKNGTLASTVLVLNELSEYDDDLAQWAMRNLEAKFAS